MAVHKHRYKADNSMDSTSCCNTDLTGREPVVGPGDPQSTHVKQADSTQRNNLGNFRQQMSKELYSGLLPMHSAARDKLAEAHTIVN